MPNTCPPSDDRELFTKILAAVSRSFYLTLRVLPKALREPIALAYLLARSSDSLADHAALPAAERAEALLALAATLRDPDAPLPPLPTVAGPAEQRLLSQFPTLRRLLFASPDREEITRVLGTIIAGQRLDVERFPAAGAPLRALETEAELDDYTYRVAGCVGDFWTRLCLRHLPHFSRCKPAELLNHGVAFGKGLQWINILRDAPEDLRNGRCYFPLSTLREAGLTPGDLLAHPEQARPLYARWVATAREHLAAGRSYIEAIRPGRVRLACFLPWAIGHRTLDRLEATPPLEQATRVKVPRSEIRTIFLQGLRLWWSDGVLDHYRTTPLSGLARG